MASQDTYIDVSYYECLGIDKGASQKEIKKAFYAKARLVHPDKNQSDPCAEEHVRNWFLRELAQSEP
jgi:curved DNA-binding protein CbpA